MNDRRSTSLKSHYDAVIVGARCAGASTGMLLARQGLRVLVIDRSRYGTDTLSTHALMRGGVLQLNRWGVLGRLVEAGTPAVKMTSFHYGDEVVDIVIKPRDGVEALYAPRRTVLDKLLVDAARESGAEIVYGTRLVDLLRTSQHRVRGVVVRTPGGPTIRVGADIVIGADGVGSTTAGLVGALPFREGLYSTGLVFGYWSDLPIEGYHWHYRPGVSAGTIPTNDGQTLVFACVPTDRFQKEIAADKMSGYYRVLQECSPELVRELKNARLASPLRGFPGTPGFLRRCWGPGWALVGDAGYFRDPLTAHGMTDALRDAEFLASAVAEGTEQALAEYQSTRDDLSLGLFQGSDDIASFKWDLPTVQGYHLGISREMGREVEALLALHEKQDLGSTRSRTA